MIYLYILILIFTFDRAEVGCSVILQMANPVHSEPVPDVVGMAI